jgi:hypothetical protein
VQRYYRVIKSSVGIFSLILFLIVYCAWIGNIIFRGTIEGTTSFPSFGASFFTMFTLLTTSNYPDVMLPAYSIHRISCLFFISFLCIALFLLMNLMLAIFYANYQEREDIRIDKFRPKRNLYLFQLFRNQDTSGKGQLDKASSLEFMKEVHGLCNKQNKMSELKGLSTSQYDMMWSIIDFD